MKALLGALFLFGGIALGADHPPLHPLRLELTTDPPAVTFTNTGTTPLRILKPLDGSEWCWIMPHYKLTVTDAGGKEVPFGPRCGMFGLPYSGTKWPDDYLVVIPAGGTYRHELELHHCIKTAGTYGLRFQYVFSPKTNKFPGGSYPPDLWRGDATSNAVSTRLESNQ